MTPTPAPTTAHTAAPVLALASRSPRRRELLDGAGLAHEVIASGIDDGELSCGVVDPAHWVTALAYMKAAGGAGQWAASNPESPAVVLGADTVCVIDGPGGPRVIGQPNHAGAAREVLQELAGGTHRVVTGVAMIEVGTSVRDLFVCHATVRFPAITDDDLEAYIATGRWSGKAGGYNLSERLAAGWPIEYEGDPDTIVGLPVTKLIDHLAPFGITPTP